jgi:hypothetical protein
MKMKMTIFSVLVLFLVFVGCNDIGGNGDGNEPVDDNDNDSGDDDGDDDDVAGDDDSSDDDSDDDDTGDDDDDDDDDDNLPECAPYQEGQLWLEMYIGNSYSEYLIERDGEGILTATVTVNGNEITFDKGTYSFSILWTRTDADHPFVNGQTVFIFEDRFNPWEYCCYTEEFQVWDEDRNYLFGHAVGAAPSTLTFGGETYNSGAEWTRICEYYDPAEGPHQSYEWEWMAGLSLSGYYESSHYAVDLPGGSTITDDGEFAVNWPKGYWGAGYFYPHGEWWEDLGTMIEIVKIVE